MAGPLQKLQFSFSHQPLKPEGEAEDPLLRQIQELQQYLKEAIQRINDTPWTTSRTIAFTFAGGAVEGIAHGLGRMPTRWTVDDISLATFSGYRDSWDEKFIYIYSDNPGAIVLRIE